MSKSNMVLYPCENNHRMTCGDWLLLSRDRLCHCHLNRGSSSSLQQGYASPEVADRAQTRSATYREKHSLAA